MPPCAICEEAELAPEQKSPFSTSRTSTPLSARSRNVPIPLMPPPMINTETVGLFLRVAKISLRVIHQVPLSTLSHIGGAVFCVSEYIVFHMLASLRYTVFSRTASNDAPLLKKIFRSSTFFRQAAPHPG